MRETNEKGYFNRCVGTDPFQSQLPVSGAKMFSLPQYRERTFHLRNFISCFGQKRGGQRTLPALLLFIQSMAFSSKLSICQSGIVLGGMF